MDTNAERPDDLSAVERRLSAWAPAAAGLDADAMLFAAGRAAARPGAGRFVWPAVACSMTVAVAVLGFQLAVERSERQLLIAQLRRPAPAPDLSPAPGIETVRTDPPAVEATAPNSLLASHRALEQGLDAWPAQPMDRVGETPGPSSPVLRVGQPDSLLDP